MRAGYLALPQPPLSCALTQYTPGKLLEKVLDVIGTGVGMPQFVNADVMLKRALYLWGHTDRVGDLPLGKARRTCVGACVGSYIPYETGHPVEGQPNLGKVLELTMNNGFDPRTEEADRAQDRGSRDVQELRRTVHGIRAAASVL